MAIPYRRFHFKSRSTGDYADDFSVRVMHCMVGGCSLLLTVIQHWKEVRSFEEYILGVSPLEKALKSFFRKVSVGYFMSKIRCISKKSVFTQMISQLSIFFDVCAVAL